MNSVNPSEQKKIKHFLYGEDIYNFFLNLKNVIGLANLIVK